jgi:hypothetical protein
MMNLTAAQIETLADKVLPDVIGAVVAQPHVAAQGGRDALTSARAGGERIACGDAGLFRGAGFTDGLPVVPPTADLVSAMIEASGLPAEASWRWSRPAR